MTEQGNPPVRRNPVAHKLAAVANVSDQKAHSALVWMAEKARQVNPRSTPIQYQFQGKIPLHMLKSITEVKGRGKGYTVRRSGKKVTVTSTGTPDSYCWIIEAEAPTRDKKVPIVFVIHEYPKRKKNPKRGVVSQAQNSIQTKPWQVVRVPGLGAITTEPFDTDDTFSGAVASYEVVDGWLVYHGRNGSVGVVVGTASELKNWARLVDNMMKLSPLKESWEWTPEDGGEQYVKKAVKLAERVMGIFGERVPIEVWVEEGGAAPRGSVVGGKGLTLVNVHLGPSAGSKDYLGGTRLPHYLQIAAHEGAHLGYHKGGKQVLRALQTHVKEGGDSLTLYHALAGHFEGVMEAAAFYVLAPGQFRKAAPEVYEATRNWFEPKRRKNPKFKVGDRVIEGRRKGKVTALHSPGTVDVLFDDMSYAIRRQAPNVRKR